MEEESTGRSTSLGGSLPVASVQALAVSSKLNDVPERYIRTEEFEPDLIHNDWDSDDDSCEYEMPVVDLGKLLGVESDEEAAKLKYACEDWGFFQLMNHGVSDEVVERMKADLQEFFRLPLEAKLASSQPPGTVEGYGQAFVVSEEQKLDWSDMLFLYTQPFSIRNTKLWPVHPKTFSDTLDVYSRELKKIAEILVGFMAISLGLAAEKLTDLFRDGMQSSRMNYYPPCTCPDKVLGISPHSDGVGLTLLLQIDEVMGLEIKRKGRWLPVRPLAGAFIVNIGDILEIMTNGEYKSIEHRVLVNKDKERLSIAMFHSPSFQALVGPLLDLTKNKGQQPRYMTVNGEEFLRMLFSSKLDGKNTLNLMKLST